MCVCVHGSTLVPIDGSVTTMSHNSKQLPAPKMCKSPNNKQQSSSSYTLNNKTDRIDYENMNTNCTIVGSNNLNLVKKQPQQQQLAMSPAYSNPSPVFPQSPYSSPGSLKSPSPSLKPPTPQPLQPQQTFPVMIVMGCSMTTCYFAL